MSRVRRPVRAEGDGYVVDIGDEEADVVRRLVGELRELLTDDEPDSETWVRAIREVEVDAARFELPEGYARSWVPPF